MHDPMARVCTVSSESSDDNSGNVCVPMASKVFLCIPDYSLGNPELNGVMVGIFYLLYLL